MLEKSNWDSVFMGKLNTEYPMNVNKNNDYIRYYIEIISLEPTSFPGEEKRVIGFSDEIEKKGFRDNKNLSDLERTEELKEFLNDYYILFKVKINKHNEYDKYYYNAYEIELQLKEIEMNDSYFFPVPLLRTTTSNVENLLEKLTNNEFLRGIKGISIEEEDCPSFVLLGIREDKDINGLSESSLHSIKKIYAFGPIENFSYSEEYGFKFVTNNKENKYIELPDILLDNYYASKDDVAFVTRDVDNKISELLITKGKSMGNKEVTKIEDQDEKEFLEIFKRVSLRKELSYDDVDLANFHTAMKTQSFVILAGMSGTGKSQIVQCYYEALNIFSHPNRIEGHYSGSKLLFAPVRPFWQDDSDLLGYLDTLNGIYRPGDAGLVDFIIEASKNKSECYIVCLDEMNLARVEHYFSQFLSLLERDLKSRTLQLYNEKLHGRVYNQNDYPPTITLGENLFFVGTVNLDESTYQFSDKVLDRANVINLKIKPFKEIKKLIAEEREKKQYKKVESLQLEEGLKTYNKFKGMQKTNTNEGLTDDELDFLWQMNLKINEVNEKGGIGYRIKNQIEKYIINLPKESKLTREVAFDIQIKQRVLTKLRGSEMQLSGLVGTMESEEYQNGVLYELLEKSNEISSFKESKEKLQNLAKEILEYGHTI